MTDTELAPRSECRPLGCVGGHPTDEYHRDAHGTTIADEPAKEGTA